MILVIAEQHNGKLNRASWETIAAAQHLEGPVKVAVAGHDVDRVGQELAEAAVDEVLLVVHPLLQRYTADGFTAAYADLIGREAPGLVFLPHTYQTRDVAPKLAARLDRALVTDCVSVRSTSDGFQYVRPVFQGKLSAAVVAEGPPPHFATFQIGAYRADQAKRGSAPIRRVEVSIAAAAIRQTPDEPFQEAKQAVDLSQAERIVAVGRGIKSQEHLAVAQRLAALLGAEVAASRPICDAGWLPMERQIGSSGQTVAPKLYIALGISGAIQHVVGMKGSRTIVAINKDAEAPIFEVADYGIVGDLFEVVPQIIAELEKGS